MGVMSFLSKLGDLFRTKATIDDMRISGMPPQLVEYVRLFGSVGTYGALYRRQPSVRSCVDFLSRNVAQLTPKLYERLGDADRLHLDDHPLAVLFRRPNPGPTGGVPTTKYRLFRDTVADFSIYDVAYWLKIRSPRGGAPKALRRLPPTALWPERDPQTGLILGYRTVRNQLLDTRDLVVFPGYDPSSEDGSTPPLETLRQSLAEEWAAGAYRENMWKRGARQGGVIERPADIDPLVGDALDRFMEDWRSMTTGTSNSGNSALLQEGMKWIQSAFSAVDTQYIEARKLHLEECAHVYAIPPPIIGLMEGAGESNLEEAHKQMLADCLTPIVERMEEEIEVQLLPEFSAFDSGAREYVEMNLAEKLRGRFEKTAQMLTSSVGAPWMTINEARAYLNLPRIDEEWADMPIRPLNVLYGGQPAPNVPLGTGGSPEAIAARAEAEEETDKVLGVLLNTLGRQEKTVLNRLKLNGHNSPHIGYVFEGDRWDRELKDDLQKVGIDGARISRSFNETTAYLLEAMFEDSEEDPKDAAAAVFAAVRDEISGTTPQEENKKSGSPETD